MKHIYVVELLPQKADLKKDVIGVWTYSWYWLVHLINPFVYVLYWPRCREALWIMMKDIVSPIRKHLPRPVRNQKSEIDCTIQPIYDNRLSVDEKLSMVQMGHLSNWSNILYFNNKWYFYVISKVGLHHWCTFCSFACFSGCWFLKS